MLQLGETVLYSARVKKVGVTCWRSQGLSVLVFLCFCSAVT